MRGILRVLLLLAAAAVASGTSSSSSSHSSSSSSSSSRSSSSSSSSAASRGSLSGSFSPLTQADLLAATQSTAKYTGQGAIVSGLARLRAPARSTAMLPITLVEILLSHTRAHESAQNKTSDTATLQVNTPARRQGTFSPRVFWLDKSTNRWRRVCKEHTETQNNQGEALVAVSVSSTVFQNPGFNPSASSANCNAALTSLCDGRGGFAQLFEVEDTIWDTELCSPPGTDGSPKGGIWGTLLGEDSGGGFVSDEAIVGIAVGVGGAVLILVVVLCLTGKCNWLLGISGKGGDADAANISTEFVGAGAQVVERRESGLLPHQGSGAGSLLSRRQSGLRGTAVLEPVRDSPQPPESDDPFAAYMANPTVRTSVPDAEVMGAHAGSMSSIVTPTARSPSKLPPGPPVLQEEEGQIPLFQQSRRPPVPAKKLTPRLEFVQRAPSDLRRGSSVSSED